MLWKCMETYYDERNISAGWALGHNSNWSQIVADYSRTQLTFRSDRLIALQGIIKAFQKTRPVGNAFGIWTDDVPGGLLWCIGKGHPSMAGMDDAPSWSWAAKDGRKEYVQDQWENTSTTCGFCGTENRLIVFEDQVDSCDYFQWTKKLPISTEYFHTSVASSWGLIRPMSEGTMAFLSA